MCAAHARGGARALRVALAAPRCCACKPVWRTLPPPPQTPALPTAPPAPHTPAAGQATVYCHAHRESRVDGSWELLGEGSSDTEDDYGLLASTVSIDGLIINSERWNYYRVQCSTDPTYPDGEVRRAGVRKCH